MGTGRFVLPSLLAGVGAGIRLQDAGAPVLPLAGGRVAGAARVAGGATAGRLAHMGSAVIRRGVGAAGCGIGAWRGSDTDITAAPDRTSLTRLVDGAEHEVVGVVADDPRPREDRMQVVLRDVVMVVGGAPVTATDRLLAWMPRGIDLGSADRVRVRGRLEVPEDFDGFAYRAYLARQGVAVIARVRDADVVAEASGPPALLAGVRATLLGGLNRLVPEPEAALGAGILLGVRSAIAPEIEDAFAAAGLTHVVAISGWNIAIVAALVAVAARPLERGPGGRWTTAAVAVSVVGGYVLLAGASPSVVRAALMAGAMLVARLGGSRAHAASALMLAALLMLIAAPSVLWDVGFQLSLLATAGLIWFGAGIERRLPGWPGWIREPVALTLAAQLTTLPVILVNFERLSLVAPLANVLVVPFVPVAMLLAAVAALVGAATGHLPALLADSLGWLAGGAAWLVLRTIVVLGSATASIPLAAVDVSIPPPVAVAWLPVLAIVAWALADERGTEQRAALDVPGSGRARPTRLLRPVPIGAALICVLAVISLASRPDGRLHVTVLDVGQGDAILVETPTGRTMLVDGGPDPERTLRRMGANLPFFARRIDLLVLSHPHQDHVAGLVDVLARHRIGALLHAGIPFENAAADRLFADAELAGVPTILARAGLHLRLDPSTGLEVLAPSDAAAAAPLPEGDINNGSVVLALGHGGFTALLTGDAEAPVENALVSAGIVPWADLLKVGHHGSTSSTTGGLLDAARPTVAVISSGSGNEYGHPAPETLAALAARGSISVYRTDLDGDVELATDGRTMSVRAGDAWSVPVPVHGHAPAGSIGPWLYPTEPLRGGCSTRPGCRTASFDIPRAWPGWREPEPPSWRRHRSRSTVPWSKRRPCSMTSTRWRSGAPAGSTASSARDGSRRRGTRSSRCRSPPTRSAACSTTSATRSAGRRSSWPSPTGTSPRSSSPSTSGSTT
ncbi:MAG: DNA internalization-related competence protein ComEC/Rec2 [Chloroflexi bacterium]|nr:DNA internalization-related competence protein ComEC/Rec2 [Chloroflexota bacterium]